ncbi:IS21-like element helper ATPase IstB [Pseudoalteromonas rubra]|uniref:ATPase AAA n=1 Tax=Pseudoalteromonas rubra TaxID=43658 RepID=A0A0F4QM61_9GAMM|nr:IS21-like element helper ATPase IstB [Pseudoalteromonas rubra]KJZ08355.1 ATPase AAA [Pseudoalteromonas rubra]
MSNEQTVYDNLKALRLHGVSEALQKVLLTPQMCEWPLLDTLAYLTNAEMQSRDVKKRERLKRDARLKQSYACVENIDYQANRGIDKGYLATLITCDWISQNQFLVITGPTGVGKSWLACALANQAINQMRSVHYYRSGLLFEEMAIAHRDGSLPKLRNKLSRYKVIILDDFGLSPMSDGNRHDLLDLVEDRVESGSFIITSQLPVEQWHEYIGEATVADAIMDRIVHRAHIIQLHGESMRKLHSPLREGKS